MSYNYRYLHDNLSIRPTGFRAVLITGPRRSGKSTFAKELLREWGGKEYFAFDTPLEQARFKSDPEGFLRALRMPAVLDEVQNVPEIFNHLKKIIDEKPEAGCDFILTGSQQFQMMHRVSESLAGRILLKELFPFSLGEIRKTPATRILHNLDALLASRDDFEVSSDALDRSQVFKYISIGGFPPAALSDNYAHRMDWFNSYVETYIQRDVRSLSQVQDLAGFSRFVTLIAGRTGQPINFSESGKDIGVTYKTAQHYISLLESSYLWRSLPPYFRAGSEQRISKRPKGIFLDTGLALFLVGLTESGLERNPLLGRMFESYVISEIIKLLAAFGKRCMPCHFRMGERAEVDLVLEYGTNIIPIEIKCSASPHTSWGKGIHAFRNALGLPQSSPGYVISLAPQVERIAPGILNVPLGCFA